MLYVKRAQEIQKTVIAYNIPYLTFNRLMILFSFHFFISFSLFSSVGRGGGQGEVEGDKGKEV